MLNNDSFQVNQHGLINCEYNAGEPVSHYAANSQETHGADANAEMDLLETRLFAMAGART